MEVIGKNKPAKPMRDSNIELLRVLVMIGIVVSHMVFSSPQIGAIIAAHNHETFYLVLLQALGEVGNLSFFLITGYFLVHKEFNLKSITKLASMTWFYSAVLFGLAVIAGLFGLSQLLSLDTTHTTLTLQNVLLNLMPIVQNNYWFVTTYIVILFLAPALNKVIHSLSQKSLALLLIGGVVSFFALNYVSRFLNLGLSFEIYGNLLLYSFVYGIGAYLRLYPIKLKTSVIVGLLAIGIAVHIAWSYRLVYMLHATDLLIKDIDIAPFIIAVCIFALFLRLKVPYSRIINTLGASTIAVYLIHANHNISEPLWKIFDVNRFHGTPLFYIFPFVAGGIIFIACVSIELARQYVARTMVPALSARIKVVNVALTEKVKTFVATGKEPEIELTSVD